MGWIEEQFERRAQAHNPGQDETPDESRFELLAERKWIEFVNGLERDLEEYRELGGEAALTKGKNQCRISNPSAGVMGTLIADPEAYTIQYTYAAEQKNTAVPEGGFFSMRRSRRAGADLYSADQRITLEQARRMVLEPLLFPNPPRMMQKQY
jgi:hypothetical protein